LGGSLRHFERMSLHWWGLAVAGLILQVSPIPRIPGLSERGSGASILLVSYLLLLAFLVLNRFVPAAAAMALGLLLNLAVVGANAGMPVSAAAIEAAGASVPVQSAQLERGSKHHLMTDDDVLKPLGDVIPVPEPFGVVISIGDVFLYGGMAWFVFRVTRGQSHENPRPIAMWFLAYRGKHAPDHWRLSAKARSGAQSGADQTGSAR
jgi:hypothetical protein